jgi:hypothetical protein
LRTRRSKYTNVVTAAMNGVVIKDTNKLPNRSRISAPVDVSETTPDASASNASPATLVATPTSR